RRAANSARDRGCYRIGAALEPYEGHLLDDIALSGLDHLGAVGLVLLVDIAVRSPDLSLSQLLDRLFRSNHGEVIRKWGEWSRWHWLSELVNRETNVFLASEKGRDPRQRWRSEEPTLNQEYLLLEIARIGGLIAPKLSTRGDAFEWIRDQGGNPRFRNPPPSPPLPIWGA